jgi:hypothetical protein
MTDVFKLTHESQIQLLQCSQMIAKLVSSHQSYWSQFSYIIHYNIAYIISVPWQIVVTL